MEVCHKQAILQSAAAQRVRQFIARRPQLWAAGTPDFESFERELHVQIQALECELLATELARYDVSAPEIEVQGTLYHRLAASPETYLSTAGPVRVERHLYRLAGRNTKSVCPLELRVGIVNGYWTPRAARQGAFVMAHLTGGEGEQLFAELGQLQPSRSSLDRLPRELSQHWEEHRLEWEDAMRATETLPTGCHSVAFSVDGVMAPMRATAAQRVAKQAEPGKHAGGPTGYREVGCATLALYDAAGERLQTIRYARMPESRKVTLGQQLNAEAQAVIGLRPDLRRVYLSDGAEGNWRLLAEVEQALGELPTASVQIVDFFHACEHLKRGCDAIWGEGSIRGQAEFAQLKVWLKDAEDGAQRIMRRFSYYQGRLRGNPRQRLHVELMYFRNQHARMHYADYLRQHLPIASGVMEAACKTLVTQRLKCSGMTWSPAGGQAILSLRSLIQSERWSRAWTLLAADFRQTVRVSSHSDFFNLPLVA